MNRGLVVFTNGATFTFLVNKLEFLQLLSDMNDYKFVMLAETIVRTESIYQLSYSEEGYDAEGKAINAQSKSVPPPSAVDPV